MVQFHSAVDWSLWATPSMVRTVEVAVDGLNSTWVTAAVYSSAAMDRVAFFRLYGVVSGTTAMVSLLSLPRP